MPLCCFSKENEDQGFIHVDTTFIKTYMGSASEEQIKVYLYGLYLCSIPLSRDNTIDNMADALSLDQKKIINAFSFWEEQGLLTIFSYEPLQIQYHSTKNVSSYKTYSKEKYQDFNAMLEQLFADRLIINPNQYIQYYDFIESSNIQLEVLLAIIKYCIEIKGASVSVNYTLQVARAWVNDGIRTYEAVEARIRQRMLNSGEMREVAAAIGKTSLINEDDKDFYMKWKENWGFEKDAILAASKKSMKSMQKLDAVLNDCFQNNAISAIEIEEYLKNKKKLNTYAIDIANALGTWYENPTPIVETYISPWIQNGFSIDGLMMVANYCFKNSIKKLEGMAEIIDMLFKKGMISDDAIKEYFDEQSKLDDVIKEILTILASPRAVSLNDKNVYKVWTQDWGFSLDTIKFVASTLVGKTIGELSKRLSFYMSQNALSIEAIEALKNSNKNALDSTKKYDRTLAESNNEQDDYLDNYNMV